jgi:hypothetical protein
MRRSGISMQLRIDAQCALIDTQSGMVRGLARAVALALQFDQHAAARIIDP